MYSFSLSLKYAVVVSFFSASNLHRQQNPFFMAFTSTMNISSLPFSFLEHKATTFSAADVRQWQVRERRRRLAGSEWYVWWLAVPLYSLFSFLFCLLCFGVVLNGELKMMVSVAWCNFEWVIVIVPVTWQRFV